MMVNFGGQNRFLAVPPGMPRDGAKYRYFLRAEGSGWKICWEEIKPQVCRPKAMPRRIMG